MAPMVKDSQKNKINLAEWRMCPLGSHWVSPHQRLIKGKKGNKKVLVKGHCARNQSKKDQMYKNEMKIIADNFFQKLKGLPTKNKLKEYHHADDFDWYILGWVTYWNSIFKPEIPLDVNLLKALILTESSFRTNLKIPAGKRKFAYGLMQITNETQSILADERGELKNHLINLTIDDLYDPNLNICAGVRWLFRKRETASHRLKRKADWFETIADYKSYLKDMISGKDPNPQAMKDLRKFYERLKK